MAKRSHDLLMAMSMIVCMCRRRVGGELFVRGRLRRRGPGVCFTKAALFDGYE